MAQPSGPLTGAVTIELTPRLTAAAERLEGGFVRLKLTGVINEDFDFTQAIDLLASVMGENAKAILFDLGEVSQLNSVGVRGWLLFIQHVQAAKPAFFYRLNEIFVEQASIVPNLLGKKGTKVLMFDLPYSCSKCLTRIVKVVKTKQVGLQNGKYTIPEFDCEKCGSRLEFDAIEKEYFNFLKYTDDH